MANYQHDDNKQDHGSHQLIPISVYMKTLVMLLILTVITVAVSYVDFGKANIFVSLGIATVKASLVMMFFMGLYYDSLLNRVYILASFAALALFLYFAAADAWTRSKPEPVKVHAAAASVSEDELKKLEAGSPDLVAKGKEIFGVNCTSCHGNEGKGDGMAAAALNPKPRNFLGPISAWTHGASVKSIYVTLAHGSPGTGMASYKALPASDRFALVHFIRSMMPEKPSSGTSDGTYAAVLKEDGIGGGATASKPKIPVDFILERMSRE